MGLLLILLLCSQSIPEKLESTAEGILSHLSLLFVPATVALAILVAKLLKTMRGGFASLAVGLNGLATATLIPIFFIYGSG